MASGDTLVVLHPNNNSAPSWLWVEFTSGSTEPTLGDTIWGDTSNANAVLEYLGALTSGTWAGNDAAGYMLLSNHHSTARTRGEA